MTALFTVLARRYWRSAFYGGALLLGLPAATHAQCTQLVWADEFNNAALDTTKWKVITGDGCPTVCGWGNAELENYRAQNIATTGGNLVISTKYETTVAPSGNTYQYSSGKLQSKIPGKGTLQTFKYGRIEARMQLPSAGGVWPAFWMLADPGNWPTTGEIDIMEAKHKNPNSVTGTAIGNAGGGNPYFASRTYAAGVDLSTGFHVYALEWGPDVLRFYVDGNLYNTVTPQSTPNGVFPFNDNNFYVILNAAVGGPGSGYTGYIAPTPADYPTQTLVDYVRIYKGTYNYAVIGDGQVFPNEQYKNYRLDPVAGATYAWTVPSGATIVSGQGTNTITVNWGSTGGTVAVSVAVSGCTTGSYSKAVTIGPALQVEKVFEDFETNRLLTYAGTGTLTQAVANPSSAAPNTSSTVGKYVRAISQQYDVLNVKNLAIANANDFVAGRKKVYVDVYSTAPVGSKVTMQFENSSVTTATNYPSGRHSAYKAFTTKQNAWETLEFTYEQTIDAGTSVFAINNVAFLFEPATYTGDTFYFDNVRVLTQPTPPTVATTVLENYDGTSAISFDATGTNGTYTAAVANPSATGVNTSAKVAKYVRNSTQQYDVLFFNATPAGTVITDAGKFKDQTYQLQLDLYTDAPVGTSVRITLQNKAAAAGTYPAGRNSTYIVNTTKQNAWETLTLVFDTAPDAGTANVAIDQLAVLFAGNSNTGNTYYLDNLRIAKHVADPTYTAGTTFEDYEATHNLTYLSSDGTYSPTVANPSATGANTSAHVGKYARKATATYDVLSFSTNSIKDGSAYVAGTKVLAMDVYTSAPVGTVISWQLESSAASAPGNYPAGRHSIYQAVVQKTNTWHTLVFTYASSPDASTADATVDRAVFLFAPNSSTGDVYYVDNLRSLSKNGATTPVNVAPTVSLTSPAAGAAYTAPASLTLTANAADSDGTVSKVEFYQGTTLLGTATASPYSYTWTGVAAGTYSLTAKATDNAGTTTTSAAVSVTVNAASTVTNLALNKPTFTSSTENTGTPGSAAVDGNATSTRWASAFADPQWLYVDLGASYNVNRVKLTWEAAYGKDYLIQTSPDAATWTTIKTVASNTTLTNDWTGLAGTGRYVRMYGTARGTTYGYSLYELEVYGTAASGGTGTGTGTACSGTVASGDYTYQVSTTSGNVNWTFIPQSPITGSTMALIYIKAGTATGYAGYQMTASGSNFTFSQAQPAGTAISFYFTYRVGTSTAERNSSATPHSYTAGTTCTGRLMATAPASAASPSSEAVYPNPVTNRLTVALTGSATHTLVLRDLRGAVVHTATAEAGQTSTELNVSRLAAGVYLLTVSSAEGQQVHRIMKE
jgi:beta-glucanase (GH16 family)